MFPVPESVRYHALPISVALLLRAEGPEDRQIQARPP